MKLRRAGFHGLVVLLGLAVSAVGREAANPDQKLPEYSSLKKPLQGSLQVAGSGVMFDLLRKLSEAFVKIYPQVQIKVELTSSSSVPSLLTDEKLEIGAMSRPMETSEKEDFQEKHGVALREFCIARDAYRIIVNAGNPLKEITLEDLDGIYSDLRLRGGPDIQTWGDLGLAQGWETQPVRAIAGWDNWGSTKEFERLVSLGQPARSGIARTQGSLQKTLPEEVSHDLCAIGYTSIISKQDGVKALAVALKPEGPYVECTRKTLVDGSYPLARDFFLYIAPDSHKEVPREVLEFLRFILSEQGQAIVTEAGLVPLSLDRIKEERGKISPKPPSPP